MGAVAAFFLAIIFERGEEEGYSLEQTYILPGDRMASHEELTLFPSTGTSPEEDGNDAPVSLENGRKMLRHITAVHLYYPQNTPPSLSRMTSSNSTEEDFSRNMDVYDTLFPSPCDESICTLPGWMLRYFRWHQRKRTQLKTPDDWSHQQLLLVRCYEGDQCGGTADRLKALPFYLAVAAKTRRLLLIRWARPLALETFLTPRSINWTVPEDVVPLMDNTTSSTYSGATDITDLVNKASRKKWLVQAAVQRSATDQYTELVMSMEQFSDVSEVTKTDYIFRDMFFSLFQPSDAIQSMTEEQLQKLQLRPNHFVAAHIRANYPGELYRRSNRKLSVLEEAVSNAVECAASLQPPASNLSVYVASDTVLALEAAKSIGQNTTSSYRIVSLLDASDQELDGLGSNLHLNNENNDVSNPSAFYSIFVDLLIIKHMGNTTMQTEGEKSNSDQEKNPETTGPAASSQQRQPPVLAPDASMQFGYQPYGYGNQPINVPPSHAPPNPPSKSGKSLPSSRSATPTQPAYAYPPYPPGPVGAAPWTAMPPYPSQPYHQPPPSYPALLPASSTAPVQVPPQNVPISAAPTDPTTTVANTTHPFPHPRHQGKNPPKKKRAPRGKAQGSTSSKNTPTSNKSTDSSKREVRRTSSSSGKSRPRLRTSTSGSNVIAKRKHAVRIVSDEAPDRIVNPLLEIPRTPSEPTHSAELLAISELVFHPPDTYPLSYLARLLGFQVPVPDLDAAEHSDTYHFPTPFPDVSSLVFGERSPEHDVFFQVPQAGPPLTQIHRHGEYTAAKSKSKKLGDVDDQQILDGMDPVYEYFLRHGLEKSSCKPGSSTLWVKLSSPMKTIVPRIRQLLREMAVSLGVVDATYEWTFLDWAAVNGPGMSSSPQWTMNDGSVVSTPPSQSFGVVACYQGTPMALLQYKFLWHPVQTTHESELVMVMEGFGERTGTVIVVQNTPAVPVVAPATPQTPEPEDKAPPLECLNPTSTPAVGNMETPMQSPVPVPVPEPQTIRKVEPFVSTSPELDDTVRLQMIALALDHARVVDVWYCLWDTPKDLVELNRKSFRMVPPSTPSAHSEHVVMICDLKKCSSRYALLKEKEKKNGTPETGKDAEVSSAKERSLVRLPTMEEARSIFDPLFAETQRTKRLFPKSSDVLYGSATGAVKEAMVHLRVTLPDGSDVNSPKLTVSSLKEDGVTVEKDNISLMEDATAFPQLDILRTFPLSMPPPVDSEPDEILRGLLQAQASLLEVEKSLEPTARELMTKVVEEREEFERPGTREKIAKEKDILKRNEKLAEQRKKDDEAWQEKLEQDMNAVCNICNDGEVTPDNQILFCEACDVPVHQMCYGIEEVPEGDYYCIACQHFGREKMLQDMAKRNGRRVSLPPLPTWCELCPVRKGAYVRTANTTNDSNMSKFVHMVCAKWQGLNFVVPGKADVVEDVTELKKYFRRLDYSCAICKGKRGAYQQCRHEDCDLWMHVTCARAIGVCEVIHGEDSEGPVERDPWTLLCPKHSAIDPATLTKDPVPVEKLIEAAKGFPEEPMPEPLPVAHKPFNKQNGKERQLALANPQYEQELIEEFLSKKLAGARCEVCYIVEEDGKSLARCDCCGSIVCFTCRFRDDDGPVEQRHFVCFACCYVKKMKKLKEEFSEPHCQMCNQRKGLLLPSFANPVNRLSYWKNNEKEFQKTIFASTTWIHYACAFWMKGVEIDGRNCRVDCSNVAMSNGRGYIRAHTKCGLCGMSSGMKARCADVNCRARDERRQGYYFHISCARQAGYEVQHEDDVDPPFYVHCYVHGGCEYNLRAKLEDLIEVEKRRAGKTFSKAGSPMAFADGSRILYQAISVLGILGWAWRWAEHWVEYGSSWEPLLEPGEKEEDMTKEQLKIVDSTPESRANDARRCRLAAFGAALRNRAYDTEGGFDNESLQRALRAILKTPSLVGPLEKFEVDFFVEWLARAYRTKSPLLGFGDDKIPVAQDGFCVHSSDKTPKYELGNRTLPGKETLPAKQFVETKIDETDDFLVPEHFTDGKPPPSPQRIATPSRPPAKAQSETKQEKTDSSVSRKRGPPSESGSSTQTKKTKRCSNQKVPREVVSSPSRGRGRPPKVRNEPKEEPIQALPSPLRSPKKPIVVARTRKGQTEGLGLEAVIEYAYLQTQATEDSVLKRFSRRGRPPRWLQLATYLVIDGKDYVPDDLDIAPTSEEQAHESETNSLSDKGNGDNPKQAGSEQPISDDMDVDKQSTGVIQKISEASNEPTPVSEEDSPMEAEKSEEPVDGEPMSDVANGTEEAATEGETPTDTNNATKSDNATNMDASMEPETPQIASSDIPNEQTNSKPDSASEPIQNKAVAIEKNVEVPNEPEIPISDSAADTGTGEDNKRSPTIPDPSDIPESPKSPPTPKKSPRLKKRQLSENSTDGPRRSSRFSPAKAISLKEPDDLFDEPEDLTPETKPSTPRKRGRPRKGSSKQPSPKNIAAPRRMLRRRASKTGNSSSDDDNGSKDEAYAP
eukprot:Nitzschia sp. Nitz4//scaffold25_size161228//71935//80159//NITZ4_002431-RA/size161228-augustus-gene-0.113-mRNA-1//1//CDS//3329544589//149//frame0